MLRQVTLRFVPITLGLLLSLLWVMPVLAGPPWISIEIPPNPFDRTTRDAFLLVHTYHHGHVHEFSVVGTAEGLVKGQRQTVRLEVNETSRPGVYAVKKQWPSEGAWALVISVNGEGENTATALVEVGSNGQVLSVKVPTSSRFGYTMPRKVSAKEVDALLRARAAELAKAG